MGAVTATQTVSDCTVTVTATATLPVTVCTRSCDLNRWQIWDALSLKIIPMLIALEGAKSEL